MPRSPGVPGIPRHHRGRSTLEHPGDTRRGGGTGAPRTARPRPSRGTSGGSLDTPKGLHKSGVRPPRAWLARPHDAPRSKRHPNDACRAGDLSNKACPRCRSIDSPGQGCPIASRRRPATEESRYRHQSLPRCRSGRASQEEGRASRSASGPRPRRSRHRPPDRRGRSGHGFRAPRTSLDRGLPGQALGAWRDLRTRVRGAIPIAPDVRLDHRRNRDHRVASGAPRARSARRVSKCVGPSVRLRAA
jgi:hypothetical protein